MKKITNKEIQRNILWVVIRRLVDEESFTFDDEFIQEFHDFLEDEYEQKVPVERVKKAMQDILSRFSRLYRELK